MVSGARHTWGMSMVSELRLIGELSSVGMVSEPGLASESEFGHHFCSKCGIKSLHDCEVRVSESDFMQVIEYHPREG